MYQENKPQYRILLLIALAHGLNDLIQGVIPSIYPTLQSKYALTMTQVGVITLCYQLSASILQPLVGNYTDKHPKPYSQVLGMAFTTIGIVSLSLASSYAAILCSVVFIGGRFIGISPRSIPSSLFSLRWQALICSSYLSIRREFWHSLSPSVGDIAIVEQKSNRWESCRRESSR